MTRHHFFKFGIGLIFLCIAIVLCWAFGAYLINPYFNKSKGRGYIEVPGFGMLEDERPTKLNFRLITKDGFLKKNTIQSVWVIKHSSKKVTVFSPICPHLGCEFNWNESQQKFICPCHASIFNRAGKVLEGPAPRSLDTLPCKILKEKLYIEWELFKPGIPEKVEI